MDIDVLNDGDVKVVFPKGRIDSSTAPEFEKVVMPLVNGGAGKVKLNFSHVTFLSSAGLRTLVLAAKVLKARGEKLTIQAVPATTFQVLAVSGLTTFIDAQPA